MRSFALLAIMVALAAGCWRPSTARAESAAVLAPPADGSSPGVALAQAVSEITGVAISPLLGVSAIGAWKYLRAQTAEQRAKLPWFSNPWFWIPALVLVTACLLKDTLGLAAPRLLKKPLDVADTIEHKISGLIAIGAFVPLVSAVFQSAKPESFLAGSNGFVATIDLSWLGNSIVVPVAMLAFFIVFLASNAINVMILLSPFAAVDAALKGFRLLVLLTVTGSALANPWLGAVWAMVIIAIAYLIAGWSFRLSHFGLAFIWDLVTLRQGRFEPSPAVNRMFLARQMDKVPARTYGKLVRGERGSLALKFRPWLVLPERTLVLPEGRYAVGRGLFYSQIMKEEGAGLTAALLLPPRYRGHEAELVAIYALAGVREAGLRAAFRWLKELLGAKPQPA